MAKELQMVTDEGIVVYDQLIKEYIKNADVKTVNGHTVDTDVPENAVFTDTKYQPATETSDGLMTAEDKKKINSTVAANDTQITIKANGSAVGSFTTNTTKQTEINITIPTKASDINALDSSTVIPTSLSGLTDDATHRTVTDEEKSTWNNKMDSVELSTVATSGNYNDLINKPTSLPASDVKDWAKADTKPTYTAEEVGAMASTVTHLSGDISVNEKGVAGGVATLGDDGKVLAGQLPSYVDDVLDYDGRDSFPTEGESGKIYVDTRTNKTYRWSGSTYVEISSSIVIGTTSGTALDGKVGTDHIADASNPHNVTKEQVGLGDVENKSSATIRSELTKENVTDALGYTPSETDTTYDVVTEDSNGLMIASDKVKLDGIAEGATANVGTITEIIMNGKSVGAEGSVDLGTVITDVSDKAEKDHTHMVADIEDFPSAMPASDVSAWAKADTKPTYTATEVGLGNVENKSSATIRSELTKENVTSALGYEPPVSDTTYDVVTEDSNGLMIASDKVKLDGIAEGATANVGTITEIIMNGKSVGAEGSVDLGTVITDVSNKSNIGHGHNKEDIVDFPKSMPASDVFAWAKAETKPEYTLEELGAMSADVTHLSGDIAISEKGMTNGVATLGDDGKIPAAQLPSYVDDVLEYENMDSFPETGESSKIYIDIATNKSYRWSGTQYSEISASIAIGETSGTALDGKVGTDHINNTNNPHSVTKEQVGLGNVENKSSAIIRSEITKDNVTSALGYEPPVSDTTYDLATSTSSGLMSSVDKNKLDSIDEESMTGKVIELTRAEYDALPDSKLNDNKIYNITDEDLPNTANVVIYDNAKSGLQANNVQDAIDTLSATSNSGTHSFGWTPCGTWVTGKTLYRKTVMASISQAYQNLTIATQGHTLLFVKYMYYHIPNTSRYLETVKDVQTCMEVDGNNVVINQGIVGWEICFEVYAEM